jgi:tetratricopeptide (TPR) repeat protein
MSILASIMLLAQVGPYTAPGAGSGPRIPPPALEGREPKPKTVPSVVAPVRRTALETCFTLAQSDPGEALVAADEALAGKGSADPVGAQSCKAIALLGLERWSEAEAAFLAARDLISEADPGARAEQEAGAAIAAEAQGQFERAVGQFAQAFDHAKQAGNLQLVGRVARDRANSLFRLGRKTEALASLNEARNRLPADPTTWIISARAARLDKRLDDAQVLIQTAAKLDPRDPVIGLEAGVIAALSGRENAARLSWQSVIATAPASPEATQAKAWLEQLGPASTAPSKPK